MKKMAVIFPGIGYHADKPLLYYGRKVAIEAGFEDYINISYSCPVKKIRGDREKMEQAFRALYDQTADALKDINWKDYDDILFISKSIGTAIAVSYAEKKEIKNVRHVLYTPLAETFDVLEKTKTLQGMAFIGTKDPWSDVSRVIELSKEKGVPINVYSDANHSLETDDTMHNLDILKDVMTKSREYIGGKA